MTDFTTAAIGLIDLASLNGIETPGADRGPGHWQRNTRGPIRLIPEQQMYERYLN